MSSQQRIEPWIQTWSGHALDLLDPQPSQVWLCDIAMSLERMPRFNGHTTFRTWSIAHHSLLVANLVSQADDEDDASRRLAALLHDAHEAYIGDITSPLKMALCDLARAPIVDQISRPIQRVIHGRFGLPATLPLEWRKAIRHADMTALAIEASLFMGPPPRPWMVVLPPVPDDAAEQIEAVDLYFRAGFGFTALVTNAINAMNTTTASNG